MTPARGSIEGGVGGGVAGEGDAPRPPVNVLTGFLGSGKTTLLRQARRTCRHEPHRLGLEVGDRIVVEDDPVVRPQQDLGAEPPRAALRPHFEVPNGERLVFDRQRVVRGDRNAGVNAPDGPPPRAAHARRTRTTAV